MKILFLHGWTSTPGGVKPSYLKTHGHTVLNPALPDEDFEAAVAIAQAEFDRHHPGVVVGSSRGGAVAMNIDAGTTPLVLLCPAWKRWGTATTVKPGTVILHSRADDSLVYCEGYALLKGSSLPIIHAWVTDGRGKAIDNTWPQPGVAYAGVPFRAGFVTLIALKNDAIGSLLDDYQNGYPLRGDLADRPDEWLELRGRGTARVGDDRTIR